AFAIHDPRCRRLFMARDRVGVKPLFYSLNKGCLSFASSFPALLCFSSVPRELDVEACSHYLTTIRTTLGRRTLLKGIYSLMPGEYLLVSRGQTECELRRYWDFPVVAASEKSEAPLAEAAAQGRALLESSVKEQLISDVPLGGFLSGGIDSSILSTLAQRFTAGHYNAYSVGYDLEGYNEWPFVRIAATRYGMWCKELHLVPEQYPGDWSFLVEEKGLPLSTPNEVPIYHLAKALKQDFTVALSGEGADEIFGGYVLPYASAWDYDRSQHAPLPPDAILSPVDRAIRRLYRRPFLLDHVDQHLLLNSWIPLDQKRNLMTSEAWASLRDDETVTAHYRDLFSRFAACTTFDQHLHVHARVNLEGLLFRVDSSTMAASVEARVPYTDHRLVEWAFHQPDALKMNWRTPGAAAEAETLNAAEMDRKNLIESKILLRRAFAGEVDESIMQRKKMSFPVPVREWFGGFLLQTARDTLGASPLVGTLFDPANIQHLLDTAAMPASGMALWPVVNLCLWYNMLQDKKI
ncbi:MAG: asparagine synthase-related protein, partial [Lentisphaerota bacterium]